MAAPGRGIEKGHDPERTPRRQNPQWLVHLDGPERDLQRVQSVRYDERDGVTRTVARRYAESMEGFACRVAAERLVLAVRVTMRDGTQRQLAFEAERKDR